MMRWSYKTVHYEMKKEGLLGSAFLDESEIELSLNEYGKAGWELVSLLETLDGLIAIFKQPLGLGGRAMPFQDEEGEQQTVLPRLVKVRKETRMEPRRSEEKRGRGEVAQEIVVIDDYEEDREEPRREAGKKKPQDSSDVGSIRIE